MVREIHTILYIQDNHKMPILISNSPNHIWQESQVIKVLNSTTQVQANGKFLLSSLPIDELGNWCHQDWREKH